MEELKDRILGLEKVTREMIYEWDNRYAVAHLKEINLNAQLMLIQLDYARLAHEGLG